jgi:hypothetical protein
MKGAVPYLRGRQKAQLTRMEAKPQTGLPRIWRAKRFASLDPLPREPPRLFTLTPVTYVFLFELQVNKVVTQLACLAMRGWNAEDRVSARHRGVTGA